MSEREASFALTEVFRSHSSIETEVVRALLWPAEASPQARVVMWEIRLPVALMAVVVGAALSLAGAYGLRRMRWIGLAKAGLQVRLTAMAYNLRRSATLLRPRAV